MLDLMRWASDTHANRQSLMRGSGSIDFESFLTSWKFRSSARLLLSGEILFGQPQSCVVKEEAFSKVFSSRS